MDDNFEYCLDCKKYSDTVFDKASGDTICSECGLVLEAKYVDTKSEWRTFADSENDHDLNRVGDAVNHFLHNGGLGTFIVDDKNNFNNKQARHLGQCNRLVQRQNNPDKNLVQAFASLATKASMLELAKTVVDRAQEIYKKADDIKFSRGKKDEALILACLYLACQLLDVPRTLKEIETVANGVTKKEINKIKEQLKRKMEIDSKVTTAEDLTPRSCSSIGMKHEELKAVNAILENLKEFDIRRNPKSVLAAVMYMVVQLSNNMTTLKEVSQAAGVAVGTTKKTYNELYCHASKLIPVWFAKPEDLSKLHNPRRVSAYSAMLLMDLIYCRVIRSRYAELAYEQEAQLVPLLRSNLIPISDR